jgi:hypothetical protein
MSESVHIITTETIHIHKGITIVVIKRRAEKVPAFKRVFDLDQCMEIASGYNTRGEWYEGHKASYICARSKGWMSRCAGHMTEKGEKEARLLAWCKEDALSYTYSREWREGDKRNTYNIASKRGWLELCGKHLKQEPGSTSEPSHIYLLLLDNGSSQWLKMGYAQDVSIRILGYGLPDGVTVRRLVTKPISTGKRAREIETALHRKYKGNKLIGREAKGLGMMMNGHTECYPVYMINKLSKAVLLV